MELTTHDLHDRVGALRAQTFRLIEDALAAHGFANVDATTVAKLQDAANLLGAAQRGLVHAREGVAAETPVRAAA